jgi:hypothetical protein
VVKPATPTSFPSVSDVLTPRELQVLQLIVEGRRNKEIAQLLRVTPKSVKGLGLPHWLSRSRSLHEPQLLKHAQLVLYDPVLSELAVTEAHDVDRVPRGLLPAWRHSGELALHRARTGHVRGDQVTFPDHVVDRVVQVGEGAPYE